MSSVSSFCNVPQSLLSVGSCVLVSLLPSKLVTWLCGEKEKISRLTSCVLYLLSYTKLDPFFSSLTRYKNECVLGFFPSAFLNTRGEVKVLVLRRERLAVRGGSLGVPRRLTTDWVPSELRAWKIEAAEDVQAFLT